MADVSAISPLPAVAFSVSVTNAAVVEASTAPFSNTKEIIIFNRDTAAINIFAQFADVNAGLPAVGAVTAANSTVIPAGGVLSLAIGMEGDRHAMGTAAFWAANPGGSGIQLVFLADAAGPVSVNVTYVQGPGGAGIQ